MMTEPADIRLHGAHSGGITSPPAVSTARSIKNASTPRMSVNKPDARKNPFHMAELLGAFAPLISGPFLRIECLATVPFAYFQDRPLRFSSEIRSPHSFFPR